MPDAADLAEQLADEDRAKRRQYVLANTRARWSFVGLGVALLLVARLARLAPLAWWFIVAFAAVFVAANYVMLRLARGAAFRPWSPRCAGDRPAAGGVGGCSRRSPSFSSLPAPF